MEYVCSYTRLSRALGDPNDPKLMAEHQAAMLRVAAEDGRDIPTDRRFREVGSGETIGQRPTFAALLREWEHLPENTGGVVYTPELARLSRGTLAERGRILEALARAGLKIRTPQRLFDLSDPDDELLYTFFSGLDRHELGRYRRRVKLKWDEMTREGKIITGQAGYGYRWDRTLRNLVPVAEEFETVEYLFREAPHKSTRQLSKETGLRADHIRYILKNPTYTGYPHRHCVKATWRKGGRGTQILPPEKWLLAEKPGGYPAAVTLAQFWRVQEALAGRWRGKSKPGRATEGWCRDVLRFTDEEGGRIDLASHLESKRKHMVYALKRPNRPRLYIARELVHAAALDALRKALSRPDVLEDALSELRQEAEGVSGPSPGSTEALSREIASLRRELDVLLVREMRAASAEDAASIARVRQKHDAEIKRLTRLQQQREQERRPAVDLTEIVPLLPLFAAAFEEAWAAAPEHVKRAITAFFIRRIDVVTEPVPGQRRWRREVVNVEYGEWLARFMSK